MKLDTITAPRDSAELVGTLRALYTEIERSNATAAEKLAAHDDVISRISDGLQHLQEQVQFARGMSAPSGTERALEASVVRADGSIRLTSAVERISFGGKSYEAEQAGLFDSAPQTEWHRDLLQLALTLTLANRIRGKGNNPQTVARIMAHLTKAPAGLRDRLEKAVNDTAGSGAEWIPDIPMSALYEDYFTPAGIAALFPEMAVNGPILIPKISDVGRPYIMGQVATDDPAQYQASTPTSDSQVISPVGLAARFVVDQAAAEDAIFALVPELVRRAARAIADGREDAMINGSLTATHEDAIASWNIRSRWGATGLGGSTDHRRLWDGLRRLAVARSATSDLNATQTAAGVMGLVGLMGELSASDIVILTSPEVLYRKLMTDANVLTVDKFGPRATIVTGQLAAIGGHPVVPTRWLSADLAATGLYTGAGALSGVLAVSRGAFSHYTVRRASVKQQEDITRGANNIVASLRTNFKTLSATSQKVSAFGYNML